MQPLVLLILDGWGHSRQKLGNAILSARIPQMESIKADFPSLLLQASSRSVGLEWGESGNSEVGHLTLGAGRIVFQYSPRINSAVETEEFFRNPALFTAIDHIKKTGGSLHCIGLLGSGTVHSKFDHLVALIELAKRQNVARLFLHLFTDGKDSGLKEAPSMFGKLSEQLAAKSIGSIATIIGRNYPMDRDNNWDLTKQAYDLFVNGKGEKADDVFAALDGYYAQGLDDAKIPPTILDPNGAIRDGDGIIFFNFREDSMRQIAHAFMDEQFDKFQRANLKDISVVLMTQYVEYPGRALNVAFPLLDITNGLAQTISNRGRRQLHIAETEKYAHATYFFNCLRSTPFVGETDILIESYKKADEHPEMRAAEIAKRFLDELGGSAFDFTVINLANPDVLSHTGNLEHTIKGVEVVDTIVGAMRNAVLAKDGIMLITADHGNAEALVYKRSGASETRHSQNPVPFYLIGNEFRGGTFRMEGSGDDAQGLLSDVAPTILTLMQEEVPAEMTGTSMLSLLS